MISVPIVETHFVDVGADIMEVKVPLYIGLRAVTRLGSMLLISKNTITSTSKECSIQIMAKYGYLYIKWRNHMIFSVSTSNVIHSRFFRRNPVDVFNYCTE